MMRKGAESGLGPPTVFGPPTMVAAVFDFEDQANIFKAILAPHTICRPKLEGPTVPNRADSVSSCRLSSLLSYYLPPPRPVAGLWRAWGRD